MGVGDKSCSPSLQVRRVCEEAGVAESCPVDALTCLGGERKESGRAKGMEIEQRHQHKNGEEGQERAKETASPPLWSLPPPGLLSCFPGSQLSLGALQPWGVSLGVCLSLPII